MEQKPVDCYYNELRSGVDVLYRLREEYTKAYYKEDLNRVKEVSIAVEQVMTELKRFLNTITFDSKHEC